MRDKIKGRRLNWAEVRATRFSRSCLLLTHGDTCGKCERYYSACMYEQACRKGNLAGRAGVPDQHFPYDETTKP